MKQIEPLTIWINGQTQIADLLDVAICYDNLENMATFQWKLFKSVVDEAPFFLVTGNLSILDQEYIDWGTSTDINEAAYLWVAEQLNVTII